MGYILAVIGCDMKNENMNQKTTLGQLALDSAMRWTHICYCFINNKKVRISAINKKTDSDDKILTSVEINGQSSHYYLSSRTMCTLESIS